MVALWILSLALLAMVGWLNFTKNGIKIYFIGHKENACNA